MKSFKSRAPRALKLLALLAAAAAALVLPLAATQAANPGAGTVSASSPTISWAGAPMVASGAGCKTDHDTSCDNFKLTIDPPAGSSSVKIKLQPWGDWDLYVFGPDGGMIGSSGNAPGQLETVTISNPTAGTYTVAAAAFAPAIGPDGNSYTASAELRALGDPAPGVSGTDGITVANYAAPAKIGGDAGEPSIGANWKSGNVMFQAGLTALRATFDDSLSPANVAWKDVTFPTTSAASLDPIGFLDSTTGRWFSSQLSGTTSLAAFTDDDGANWTPSEGGPLNGGVDHQTIGGGPYAQPAPLGAGSVYPHAVYYCSQDLVAALCARSDNGGVTFSPATPIYTDECGGLHGHVKVSPQGTVYVPNKNCNGRQGVVVSEDNGAHWTLRTIPNSTNGDWDPSVGTAADGTIYLGYGDGDGHPKVAVSHDHGATWTNIHDVGTPFAIKHTAFSAVVAGDADRAAYAFLGTPEPSNGAFGDNPAWPGVWHLYISTTYDGGVTWTTVDATPNDPVQKGTICAGGFNGCDNGTRNLLDFMDATVDKDGRVLVGYADGCVDVCVTGGGSSFTSLATIARQVNGKRMYAKFDVAGPPAAPNLDGKSLAGTPPSNLLTWQAPYDHGSAITEYRVYRKTASTAYSLLATVAGTSTSYSDTQLTTGETYTYRISAVNAAGEGPLSNELTPKPALSTNDPCIDPGVRILADGSGDVGWTGDPAYDLQWLSVGEPRSLGLGKLEFVVKVSSLASLPPDSTWDVVFKTANGADHFVKMDSDPAGTTVAFSYGDGTDPTDPLGTSKPADAASGYTKDGVIRIVLARSALGINVGDKLTAFNVEARIRGGVADPLPDAMPAQDVRDGSYTVKGNENCSQPQPDLTVGATDISFSGLKGNGNSQVVVAVVHNIGTAPASNVKVQFSVDGAQVGALETIGSIPAGGTGRASVVWDTHGANGTHTITASADPGNGIAESNESNNSGSRTVRVQGSKVTG